MRTATICRKTNETDIVIDINLDGTGKYDIQTELKFFKHMLEQFACHSKFDLTIKAVSLDSDEHHLVEDTALALGSAIIKALNDKKGINRYGQSILPMDEALVLCAVDLSGRPFSKVDVQINTEKISDFSTILLPHFFQSFASSSNTTVHIKQLDGADHHHIAEAAFKSFARAISSAVKIGNSKDLPSTKGTL